MTDTMTTPPTTPRAVLECPGPPKKKRRLYTSEQIENRHIIKENFPWLVCALFPDEDSD